MDNINNDSLHNEVSPFDADMIAKSEEGMIFCYKCGAGINDGEDYGVIIDGETESFCQDCRDEYCFYCHDCETYHLDTESHIEYRDETICNSCSSEYYYCHRCGRYVYCDDYNSDRDCCCNCRPDENTGVEDYHESNDWEFIGECEPSWNGKWRGIGIELEIDRDNEDTYIERKTTEAVRDVYGNLKFEHDGSLEHGFEIITHPHTVKEFYNIEWERILDICRNNGYVSHNAPCCGLHIHFSRTMFGQYEKQQAGNISKLINFFETYWYDILKISRRTEKQADDYARRYGVTDINDVKRLGKSKNEGRYYAINNTNSDTVEIRIMRGTLNPNTFLSCIDFCVNIVKNSRHIPWKDIDNVSKWLKGLKPETEKYIRFRHAFEREVNSLCA